MTQDEKIKRLTELTSLLSEAARVYEQEDREIMSNFEYDRLYDELLALEEETGIVLAGSPTHKVGYEVSSALEKERHASPMLSLNKTKSRDELRDWLGDQKGVLSWKMDGLTIVLTYDNGELVKAVTRGNGEVGEIVTANARVFRNLPLRISHKGRLILRGEAVIRYSDFENINAALPDTEAKYKNPRNLCSGSVRQLDSSITAKRSVYLYAFALILAEGSEFTTRHEQLDYLESQGFDVVERVITDKDNLIDAVESFSGKITGNDFPSDGLVLIYDDIAYGSSLGRTAKFPRDGIAFKWADEQAVTTLREVEWSASRTGLINPVAIFDPVELEGTTVSRASLHNISIMEELCLGQGDQITVYKANMIIPQIADNLTKSGTFSISGSSECGIPIENTDSLYYNPLVSRICPVCGAFTRVRDENGVRVLLCPNPSCTAKKIKLFALMASRDALNIDGMSEATIEKLISEGLLHSPTDIFKLRDHFGEIASLDGFGQKSCENLLSAIEKARETTLARLIYSLGIPNIGLSNAKLISRYVNEDPGRIPSLSADELSGIDGIGSVLAGSFAEYFQKEENLALYNALLGELTITAPKEINTSSAISGNTFVITGSVEHFSNRNEAKAFIEAHGGKVTSSVTKNTDYLINNDITSSSSKNKTAKELGIPIITEDELLKMGLSQ